MDGEQRKEKLAKIASCGFSLQPELIQSRVTLAVLPRQSAILSGVVQIENFYGI